VTVKESNETPKRRVLLACACCDGEVTKHDYGFDVLQPPSWSTYLVCQDCKKILQGGKRAERRRLERIFLKRLKNGELPT